MANFNQVTSCLIKADGKVIAQSAAGPSGGADTGYLDTVTVDKRLDCPDAFEFELNMRVEARIILLDDMREGKPVEILMGPPGSEVLVFKGEIHYIEPHFRHGGSSSLLVGGYDKTHRLTRGTSSRTWGDGVQQSDLSTSATQDVFTKAASGIGGVRDGLQAPPAPKTKVQTRYVPQLNAPDYQFLRSVQFRELHPSKQPVKVLVREALISQDQTQVHEARFSLSTVRQVARVEVVGWDPQRKKAIVGECSASDYSYGGTPGWKATGMALYGSESEGKVLRIVDRPVESKAEADAVAKEIFNQLSMDFITGEVDFLGDPNVNAGDVVELKDFGERFSGKYQVMAVTHSYRTRGEGFRTRIKIARNDVGKI